VFSGLVSLAWVVVHPHPRTPPTLLPMGWLSNYVPLISPFFRLSEPLNG
jgi:hypothetical protein